MRHRTELNEKRLKATGMTPLLDYSKLDFKVDASKCESSSYRFLLLS